MKLWRSGFILLLSAGLVGIALVRSDAQVICTGNASPPPELPVYDQPPMPGAGSIWTPGYWGGGPLGYFWVPGTWVEPPAAGLLWTPGYWGFRDGIYVWNAGYWGPHVGFYGGVDYGFGYGGAGYLGGRWVDGVFAYNRTVNNFGAVRIANAYEETVTLKNSTRVSFNGGSGGTATRPTPEEEAAARERHVAAIPLQIQHERTAGANRDLLASENHGRPAIAATAKPGEFSGTGVVAAREARPGEEGRQKPSDAMRPAGLGNKPIEREETPKAKETVRREVEPKSPADNAGSANPKQPRDEARLPADKAEPSKLREKPPERAAGTGGPAPKVATVPNVNSKSKPGSKDNKPPQ